MFCLSAGMKSEKKKYTEKHERKQQNNTKEILIWIRQKKIINQFSLLSEWANERKMGRAGQKELNWREEQKLKKADALNGYIIVVHLFCQYVCVCVSSY